MFRWILKCNVQVKYFAFIDSFLPLDATPSSFLEKRKIMAIGLPGNLARQILRRSGSGSNKSRSTLQDVPKGFLAEYVGKAQKRRFLVPVSYLSQPSFEDMLSMAETPKI
ncbi:unnamed protein product [Linum tenue]|uniref:Uncharacterized protein n=1 Tax=Linum tenue TaxID=586396 RepID=A0AAV0NAH0_9ROSI|nr:unnamed protein product [Linum tenue]